MRDITLCHPRLQALAAELIRKCADQGLQIKIGETLRTTAEQDLSLIHISEPTRP